MRSDCMKKGPTCAPQRSLLKALGLTDDEINAPLIGIVSSGSEIIPGHMHLTQIEEAVKAGVRGAGATPLKFTTIGVCDGLAMNHEGMYYSLPSRDLIADSIEIVARAHPFDGLVFISNCDKITPGMLMAMGRLNIPSIFISGGPMRAGSFRGKKVDLVSVFEAIGHHARGEIGDAMLDDLSSCACPGPGSCAGLFTANSMNCLSEALGLALPGNGTIPAVDSARIRLAKETGKRIVELVKDNILPKDLVCSDSFHNAVVLDLALGGSTNTVLHLPAIAAMFDVPFSLHLFDMLGREVPHICNLSPVGNHHMEDLHNAGGVSAVLQRLTEKNFIKASARTVSGFSLAEIAKKAVVTDGSVIRSCEHPYHEEGGIGIMHGNLTPDGAVVKLSGVPQSLMVHEGPAVVFENGEQACESILKGNIKSGDVIVIRNEGPKGGPGMREMLGPTSALVGMGLIEKVVLITDGRFSGGSTGAVIGHISPEAAADGLIAYVQNGDSIRVDFPNRLLELHVLDDEIKNRMIQANLKEKSQKFCDGAKNGYLFQYAEKVSSTSQGAMQLRNCSNDRGIV